MTTISYPLDNFQREQVRQILDSFGELFPDSSYGPMHILISDYNALDSHLEFCRGLVRGMLCEDATPEELDSVKGYDPHPVNELKADLLLLDMLALIPEDWRDIHAESVEDGE